jgi:hypothetical protein
MDGCIHEHPMLLGIAQTRVVAEGVADEVGELGEGLDAGVAGSDEDEREMGPHARWVALGRCGLQLTEDVVAEVDRVREALESERVLWESRNRQHARHGAERHDEVVVLELGRRALDDDADAPRLLVDGRRVPQQQLRVRAHDAERDDDVARLEGAGGRLGQHRRVEHEVLGTDNRRARLAEQAGDVAPGEAAAEDERPAPRLASRHRASHIIVP